MWLVEFRIDIYPYSNFLIAVYPLIIAYAIIKYRLMDIRVALTRAGIFLVLYTAVLGIPFYVGYQTRSWMFSTSVAVILATIGPIAYRIMQRKAEDLLLSQQRRYQKILLHAGSGMAREHHLDKLSTLMARIVKRTVQVSFVALFLEDREHGEYALASQRSDQKIDETLVFSYKHIFAQYLTTVREPILYEELPQEVRQALPAPLAPALIVPSFADEKLIGFLVLGEKYNKTPYSQDDINVFTILSHQAALAIANCIFFEEFKKAQEKVFAAEKLASIGGMAEGLAHQMKNRLNQFSVASGELKFEIEDLLKRNPQILEKEEDKKSFDYLVHIADSLITNVKRSDAVIKGILNFAQVEARETFFSTFSLKEVITLSLELLKIKHKVAEFPLKEEIKAEDTIYGVKAQLMESVYNMLDNGYEAILDRTARMTDEEKKAFTPQIRLSFSRNAQTCRIIIEDNGLGMNEETKKKIFAPFFTTKSSYKSGTGIGIYVVKRIIEENHKGKIWFESEYGKGTKFIIDLPLCKV